MTVSRQLVVTIAVSIEQYMAKKGVKSNRNSAAGRIAQNVVSPRQISQMHLLISVALLAVPSDVPSDVPSGVLAHFDCAGG